MTQGALGGDPMMHWQYTLPLHQSRCNDSCWLRHTHTRIHIHTHFWTSVPNQSLTTGTCHNLSLTHHSPLPAPSGLLITLWKFVNWLGMGVMERWWMNQCCVKDELACEKLLCSCATVCATACAVCCASGSSQNFSTNVGHTALKNVVLWFPFTGSKGPKHI